MFKIYKYDKSYIELFQTERDKISQILDSVCLIEHIGSTAISGVDGKGVVDIMLVFNNLDDVKSAVNLLQENGYFLSADKIYRNGRIFMSTSGERESGPGDYHLHLVAKENEDYLNSILFRDYLIQHPISKQQYIDLKYKIFDEVAGNRSEYTKQKTEFISNVIMLGRSENKT
jgi:GrpB-like predicted nucleotidyltransferase (UPF0157 family)